MDVSRETEERLRQYLDLLEIWTARINLVSKASLADGWRRHIVDSAQLLHHAPEGWTHWVDLGSGGGLPGVVIAILAHDAAPGRQITLVESDARKAAFLRTALRETGVTAEVIAMRIEDVPPLGADVLSARALAPLPRLLELSAPHMSPGAVALFPKGRNAETELKDALDRWSFACEKLSSETDPESAILKIGDLERV